MKLLFIIIFLLCFSPLSWAKNIEMIVDTDAGIDDVIAITYLLKDPHVVIKAITIESDGITHRKQAVKNIHGLLALLNHASIPVACGPDSPITGEIQSFPRFIMAINETLAKTPIPVIDADTLPCDSAENLLIKLLSHTKTPIKILAIGPLTNIAKVLQKRPELASKIDSLYVMGGAIKVHGNIDDVILNLNTTAEWNIYLDPAAAEQVFHSKIRTVLIPLDVTNQFPLNVGFDQLIKKNQSVASRFIYQLLVNNRKIQPPGVWFFWDPLAAVVAVHPEIATYTDFNMSVQLINKIQLGRTFIDDKHGAPIQVVTRVNKQKFISHLSEGLK